MKIIAIANQKGGVGKTTTSVNLAAALAASGQRILLCDLDSQANATSVLGLGEEATGSLYLALIRERAAAELILPTRLPNLWGIPADLNLAGAEVEVARMEDHMIQLRLALEPVRDSGAFDYILLDCPPSLGILMSNALAAADEILVPIQCEYYALEGLGKLMHVADQIRQSGANTHLAISGLLMTMFDTRTNLSTAVVNDVRDHFQEVLYSTIIPRSVRLGEAPSHGQTILEYDPKGAAAESYRNLAIEFLDRQSRQLSFVAPS